MPGGSKQTTTIPPVSTEEQRARQLGLSEAEARHGALLRELNLAEQGPAAVLAGIRGARSTQAVNQQQLQAQITTAEQALAALQPRLAEVQRQLRFATPQRFGEGPKEAAEREFPQLMSQQQALQQQLTQLRATPTLHPSDIPGAEERLQADITQAQRNREIETLAFEQLQQRLTSPTGLSKVEEQRLETIFGEAARRGEEDLLRFADELSGGRGLRLSDTPIAAPLLRERQRGLQGLEAIRAQQGLNLQERGLFAAQGLREFQEGLRQQAFQNRFALMGQLTQPLQSAGIGLQERIAQPTTTMRQSAGLGQILGGVGGGLLGLGLGFPGLGAGLGSAFSGLFGGGGGGLGPAPGWAPSQTQYGWVNPNQFIPGVQSDRRLKSNIRRIGTHPLGVGIYSYSIHGQPTVGVMADEVLHVKPDAVSRDQFGYLLVDYTQL